MAVIGLEMGKTFGGNAWMIVGRVMVAALGGVLFAAAGVAAAGNFSSDHQGDFLAEGTHQFYVWCSVAQDYVATAQGENAEEAQMKLYGAAKLSGNAACWPVWQGRIAAS
jgi:hypothetical protein